ncbi:tetratricopeptide repeat protein [Methylonatrum kenyense]|uniref:YfgM family protein n=1 Tax=Methylonatrum kenyense TaxID=455253 RepID=UPI0020BEEE8D|nr:tetratricopeptide repeat protein [Methylonatrum kenyense]MCK8515553.1 tetratricopeptide repeat protein [Methylonatrum kenyense]
MARYDTDEEQIDAVKAWLKENGRSLVAGAVLAVGGVVGWQQWGAHQERTAESASVAYVQLLNARETGETSDMVAELGWTVMEDYGRTIYATMAGMQLADFHVRQGDLAEAAEALRWVRDNGAESGLRHLARLRLAQVLMAAGDYDEALATVDVSDMGQYRSQYLERRGDVLAALGEIDDARSAYEEALDVEDISDTRRSLIRLKRNDLAGEAST